jgi:endonuclease G
LDTLARRAAGLHIPAVRAVWWLIVVWSFTACGRSQLLHALIDGPPVELDAGALDAGAQDAGARDAGVIDAGVRDAGVIDAGVRDAGVIDAGVPDAGRSDAGLADAGVRDAGVPDAGPFDAGVRDAGVPDAGGPDAGRDAGVDAGVRDAGTWDAGVDAGLIILDGGLRCGGAGAAAGIDVSIHTALGLPDCSGWGQAASWLLVRPQFVLSYNTQRKTPKWTSWKVEGADLGDAGRANIFFRDPLLPGGTPQAGNGDYVGSGFDRGHLCPSADRTATVTDNTATFVLTNIVPQTSQSNTGPWLSLENEVRTLVRAGKHLVVIAGPIFGATRQTIGNGVEVPVSMFKVAVVLDGPPAVASVTSTTKVYAAIVPNSTVVSGSWRAFQVTPRTVELQTGLDLLSDVPRATQDLLEQRLDP